MAITALRLATTRLDAQRAFYAGTLALPLVAQTAASFTVRAGATRLTFAAAATAAPYHFAFNIPPARLSQVKAFLMSRAPLLTRDGQDQFHAEAWNADRVYCTDAAGNLVEFIARHTLADAAAGAVSPAAVLGVSEIALPVEDVPATVAALAARLALAPYGEPTDQFAALGDERGLLLIVRTGRPWFLTTIPARVAPVAVTLSGARDAASDVSGFPYQIAIAARN